AWIGVTSPEATGFFNDGGSVIAESAKVLYGSAGNIILSAVIILACLTTAVGLISANATYFAKLFPKVSYQVFAVIFTLFSFLISNFGLATLIQITLPVLLFIYPIAMVLMFMVVIDKAWDRAPIVYGLALIATAFVSLYDGLSYVGLEIAWYKNIVSALPLADQSLGWLVPAIVGTIIGWIIHAVTKSVKKSATHPTN